MSSKHPLMVIAVVAVAYSTAVLARAGGHYPAYNVTSTVHNSQSFALQSDNLSATSATYSVADPNVSSYVGGSTGEFELDLSHQNARTVYLDFNNLNPTPSSLNSGRYPADIFSRCYDNSGNTVTLLEIAAGTSNNNCSLRINFASGGYRYSLVMAPAQSPGTGTASVACNASATDHTCTSWTITPFASGQNATVANLTKTTTSGRIVTTLVGSYSGDNFRIDVQR